MMQRPMVAMTFALAVLILTPGLTANAPADIAPPEPPKPPRPVKPDKGVELPLSIKIHDDSKPMKLELPAKVLAVKADATGAEDAKSADASRTVIAAVMLSFAAVAGGLWFARKRGRGAGMMAAALAVSAVGVWASEAWANRPPPEFPERPEPVPVPPQKKGLSIRIEGNARGNEAVLHISEAQLKSIVLEVFKENGGHGHGEGSVPPADERSAPSTRSAPPPPPTRPAPVK